MGGEQAATVLATITKDQRAREGKEVTIRINHPVGAAESQMRFLAEPQTFQRRLLTCRKIKLHQCRVPEQLNTVAVTRA